MTQITPFRLTADGRIESSEHLLCNIEKTLQSQYPSDLYFCYYKHGTKAIQECLTLDLIMDLERECIVYGVKKKTEDQQEIERPIHPLYFKK